MVYIPKTYMYHIFRDGNFLGLLPNVVSEFRLPQQINTGFAQLEVEVGLSIDTSHETLEPLTTEEGVPITTETGELIYPESIPAFVGNDNEQALVRNNNDIKVYEISENYPTGKLVFAGFISRWKADIGGGNDTVKATCLSYGAELDNYMVLGVPTVDANAASGTSTAAVYEISDTSFERQGQTITPGAGVNNISSILLKLALQDVNEPHTVTVKLWERVEDFAGGTPIGVATRELTSTTAAEYLFTFPTPASVSPGNPYYFFSVEVGSGAQGIIIYVNTAGAYAGGSKHRQFRSGGTFQDWTSEATNDLYFKTFYSSGATETPFTSQDPTAILEDVMDSYIERGGAVTYTDPSIVAPGTSVSYTFKLNTILEAIKKCLELSPSNYRWGVDPATNVLFFKPVSATADHTMILGRHIESLEVEATTENVKTEVFFTGGDTGGGENLFIRLTDTEVLETNNNRPGISRITDNRVTVVATGEALAQNELDKQNAEEYETRITINDGAYDTNLIDLGDTIGFAGFGNFIDRLILEVVSKTKTPNKVVLGLGVPPRRATAQIEAAQRAIKDLETIDNPSVPS